MAAHLAATATPTNWGSASHFEVYCSRYVGFEVVATRLLAKWVLCCLLQPVDDVGVVDVTIELQEESEIWYKYPWKRWNSECWDRIHSPSIVISSEYKFVIVHVRPITALVLTKLCAKVSATCRQLKTPSIAASISCISLKNPQSSLALFVPLFPYWACSSRLWNKWPQKQVFGDSKRHCRAISRERMYWILKLAKGDRR